MITFFALQAEQRLGMSSKEVERFLKFAVVGTIGFIIDFGLLTLFKEVFNLPTVLANTLSFSAAVVSNFTLNRYWTYPDSRAKKLSAQLFQFLMVSVVGLLINDVLVTVLEHPFDALLHSSLQFVPIHEGYIPAKIIATIVVLFWNFFINRHWTYNDVK